MSSHREAPEISKDPVADNTDTYAFVSPDRPDTVTIISNYIPLEDPAGGPNFARDREDPGDKLPAHLQALYKSLRQWRNDRAKQDGTVDRGECVFRTDEQRRGRPMAHALERRQVQEDRDR